jgi:hypothetical protein
VKKLKNNKKTTTMDALEKNIKARLKQLGKEIDSLIQDRDEVLSHRKRADMAIEINYLICRYNELREIVGEDPLFTTLPQSYLMIV